MIERFAPWMFFLTGAAGLVYQTVWMRMLIRVFGVTVYATSTVVAVFMAGLALGAILGARISSQGSTVTLRRWGVVELLTGVVALVTTFAIRALPALYASLDAGDAAPTAVVAARVALSALALLPPTLLMGATLPLLVRWLEAGPRPERAVSLLYGLNTLGAVVGVLAVGFVGIAWLGETGAVLVAVAIHVSVGALSVAFPTPRAVTPTSAPDDASAARDEPLPAWLPAAAAALVGFAALACEIAWTRLLVFLVGSSVYGFSAMLSMYLLGVGCGSLVASRLRPAHLGVLFVLLGVTALGSLRVFLELGLLTLERVHLYSPLVEPLDVLRFLRAAALVVVPMTFVSGMTFPVLVRAAQRGTASQAVARVYAWNTLGSVLGALAGGFLLLPWIGAQGAVFTAGLLFFAVATAFALMTRKLATPVSGAFAALAGLSLVVVAPSEDATFEIVQARVARAYGARIVRHTETVDATVTLIALDDNQSGKTLLLNGILTSTQSNIGRVMAHLPLMLQDAPERALVICFGVGSTFTAAREHLQKVDVVELVGEVTASFPLLDARRAHLLEAPGTRVFIDDGRNFLLRSKEKYDAIMIDGAPPIHSAGFVNLYSREMMELVSTHLTDTGVLMLWIPTHSYAEDIWSIVRGAQDVFPHSAMWRAPVGGWILLASRAPLDLSRERIEARKIAQRVPTISPWLTPELLFDQGGFIDEATLKARAAHAPALTDDHPVTEYPLQRMLRGEVLIDDTRLLLAAPGP